MKNVISIALSILYVVAVIGLGKLLGPVVSPWFIACLTALFVWAYQRFARGHLVVPLSVVFLITVAFPVAVLFVIGLPVYHSWSNTAGSIFAAFRDYGQLWGLELFAPLLAAAIGALALRRRSNIAVNKDGPTATLSGRPLP